MPNLAATLKEEIRRLARKEIKSQMGATRRAAVQHRREIARLKRLMHLQEKRLASVAAQAGKQAPKAGEPEGVPEGTRFSTRSVRAQRRRLKLSAAEYGKLIGVSAQTVYLWEQGKVRPGKPQFAALVAARGIGRREAVQRLAKRSR